MPEKKRLKPWQTKQWCLTRVSRDFVWRMEDVLDLYAEPYNPKRPLVCFDELPYQLLAEVREPLPLKPGRAVRQDYEYKRQGHCSLFMMLEPARGFRRVSVRDRRTSRDFALEMRNLVRLYPDAEVIRVALDNLNTHTPAALYQTFSPEEANALMHKLEFHYTPKHGSWLNMAEIEWSVLTRECLKRRLPDVVRVQREVDAWQRDRNERRASVKWLFSSQDARTRLSRLYP